MPEMLELLLVEDDPAIVSTLSDFLQQEGFSVTAASGQRQATALLETRRFHLALLDVTLRDGSGFALCTAIKAQYRIPVIFPKGFIQLFNHIVLGQRSSFVTNIF